MAVMTRPPREAALRQLHEKLKGRPLFELMGQLVGKLDQPEQRARAREILTLITGRDEAQAEPEPWKLWLQAQAPGAWTWERLLASNAVSEAEANVPVAEPCAQVSAATSAFPGPAGNAAVSPAAAAPEDAAPVPPGALQAAASAVPQAAGNRLRVAAEPSARSPDASKLPVTPEQEIWIKALNRHRAGQRPRWKKLLLAVLVLGALAAAGFLSWRGGLTPGISRPRGVDKPVPAALVWGCLDAAGKDLPWSASAPWSLDPDYFKTLKPQGLPEEARGWLVSLQQGKLGQGTPQVAAWFSLCLSELRFATAPPPEPRPFPTETFTPGVRRWKWRREQEGLVVAEGLSEERLEQAGRQLKMTVLRSASGCSAAHTVFLDERGLQIWAWRLKVAGRVLAGKVRRDEELGAYEISESEGGPRKTPALVPYEDGEGALPGLFTPALLGEGRQRRLLLPLAARFVSGQELFSASLLARGSERLELVPASGVFTEIWTLEAGNP